MKITYRDSGVDVQAGDDLVDWLQATQKTVPHQNRILEGIGGFASLFRGDFPEMKKPVLVSSTDGVGTKLRIAIDFKSYASIAQDLVAMCVNDLITCGAQPLFFLDYYATGRLDLAAAKEFLQGLRKSCQEADCALVGGETAEMPGIYKEGDFDCAGFSVGVVDQDKILGRHRVQVGDHVLGISSSGFHSNGYSLLRKTFEKDMKTWIDSLLRPTHIYVQLMKKLDTKHLRSCAHITGGGMQNIPRALPENVTLKLKKWSWPKEFLEAQKRTQLSDVEMLETLNCGIGFVIILDENYVKEASRIAESLNYKTYDLGRIEKGEGPQLTYD